MFHKKQLIFHLYSSCIWRISRLGFPFFFFFSQNNLVLNSLKRTSSFHYIRIQLLEISCDRSLGELSTRIILSKLVINKKFIVSVFIIELAFKCEIWSCDWNFSYALFLSRVNIPLRLCVLEIGLEQFNYKLDLFFACLKIIKA